MKRNCHVVSSSIDELHDIGVKD